MKDVTNYEGLYAITSCGKVWSYQSKKFLKPQKTKSGYLYVGLYKDTKVRKFYVHRLVAEAYIENPNNLKTIDHIDGNKEHNYIKNLQWMTQSDNTTKGCNKPVRCVETGEVFESMKIAAKEKKVNACSISAVCCGRTKTAGNYHWEVV